LFKNIISAFLSRGLLAFSNFGIFLLSSHYLGSNIFGQISLLILNVAIIQTFNEIYTGSALVYFIPKTSLLKVYSQGLLFTIVCSILLSSGFIALGKSNAEWTHLFFLSLLISLSAFHNLLLLAKEKIRIYNFLVFFGPVLLFTTLAFQIFVLKNKTFNAYLVSLYVSFFSSLILSAFFLSKLLKNNSSGVNPSLKDVIKIGFMNQLGNLAHTLSNRFNYYLLGSTALVGVYAGSTSLIESVWILSAALSPIVLSHVANQKDTTNNAKLSLQLAKICLFLGLICVLILILLPMSFFTFILGKDFEQSKTIMLLLSPGILFISFSSILSHYFSGLGQQKIQLSANLSGFIVTLIIGWPLINYLGIKGACYTASLAYFTQALILSLVFLKKNSISMYQLLSLKVDWKLIGKK
jgi:O-antigen/teichoic acid export membrane protein